MRISDWSSDVCSSDLQNTIAVEDAVAVAMVGRADDPVPCAVQQLGAYVHEGQHGLRLAAPACIAVQVGCYLTHLAAGQRLAGGVNGAGRLYHQIGHYQDGPDQQAAAEAATPPAAPQVVCQPAG